MVCLNSGIFNGKCKVVSAVSKKAVSFEKSGIALKKMVSFEKKWYRIGKFFDFLKCHKTTGKSKKSRFLSKVIHLKKNKRIRVPERKRNVSFWFYRFIELFYSCFYYKYAQPNIFR